MPRFGSISRKDLIYYLKQLGFDGPHSGGKHPFMLKENISITIPNVHRCDIGRELLKRILRQAGIEKGEWEKL
ncbi:MAG: type II toxin-antitoxin system HicA family toxin [Ignavibacteriales bacterium]|nr:type II toxin-antitoxin system HicA family toxin [Ignavibacteriales bacterium]